LETLVFEERGKLDYEQSLFLLRDSHVSTQQALKHSPIVPQHACHVSIPWAIFAPTCYASTIPEQKERLLVF